MLFSDIERLLEKASAPESEEAETIEKTATLGLWDERIETIVQKLDKLFMNFASKKRFEAEKIQKLFLSQQNKKFKT